ncbi:hypothetical protein KTG15_02595 [Methanobacterium sp. YSL]|nr:hypothetical protein [Methanobacterium sp. YSL]
MKMSVIFQDGEKRITEVKKGTITYDSRIGTYITCFNLFPLKETDEVYIFTEDNLDEFRKHYTDQLISTLKESIEDKKNSIKLFKLINELETENFNLKKLNKQLSEKISEMKQEC